MEVKVFYDEQGKVVGYYESAIPEAVQKANMPDKGDVLVGGEIAHRLADQTDPLTHSDLKIRRGKVVEMNTAEKAQVAKERAALVKAHRDALKDQQK